MINSNWKLFSLIILTAASGFLYPQTTFEKNGNVSYISTQNIYVKFESTEGISQGDTLYIISGNKRTPAVKVLFISSSSAAGKKLIDNQLSLNDVLTAFVKAKLPLNSESKGSISNSTVSTVNKNEEVNESYTAERKNYSYSNSAVTGKFSIQSYTGLSNYTNFGDYQRWRYNFSLYAKNLTGSKFSFANYISFSYRTNEWQAVKNNFFSTLRIYDFAANYQFTKGKNIWLGRHLNSKITNISSIDGLQFESKLNEKYSFGLVAGSRPDFANMGFNLKLFEFGGYISRTDSASSGIMENSIALMQQTNNFVIDRRFVYFQHSSSVVKNLNLFLSSEIDLYKKEKGKGKNDFSLTGLYFSARYTPFRIVSFLLSYDARKNVIYYETFKSFIETLIENETRQGFRGGINIRPFNKVFLNLNTGYRFSKGDPKPSRNFNAYISYSQVPAVEFTPSLTFTKLITSYVEGTTAELRLSKDLDFLNSDLSLSYQKVNYLFTYSSTKLDQNIFSADIFFRLLKKLYLNFNYEGTFQNHDSDNRIIIGLTQRF